jgi:hypothetical protein
MTLNGSLFPLVQVIGADLMFNIGSSSKKIISKGITNYMNMNAMINYLRL